MDRRRPAHLHVAIPALTLTALPSPLLSAALFSPMSEDASFLPVTPPCGPNANPFLAGFVRGGLTRRNSSLSSCSSSVNSEEEEHDLPWTAAEEDRIRDTYETYTEHQTTHSPFDASTLPSNLAHRIARAVASSRVLRPRPDAAPVQPWRHGIKSTRGKILALVKERQELDTPRQDTDLTPKRRKALVRQGSMDFAPATRNVSNLARLGSKLHGPPVAHPYPQSTRGRLQRAMSLSSIAGSPTQLAKPAKIAQNGPTTSAIKMARVASAGQHPVWPQHDDGLSSSASSNDSSSFFSAAPKSRGTGLASAFHSPALGCKTFALQLYPSPPETIKRTRTNDGSQSAGPANSVFGDRLDVPRFFLAGRDEDLMEYDSDTTASSRASSPRALPISLSHSPLSSTFDLNALNLADLEGHADGNFLDQRYLRAGEHAEQQRLGAGFTLWGQ